MIRGWSFGHDSPAVNRAVAYLVSILVCAPYFYHLAHRSTAFLGLLEDDYFYYVIIADKLVTLGKTTYDGTTLTNGFHPLWFAILVGVRWIFGRFGTAFYVALALIVLACLIITFELGRRLARQLGAPPALAGAVAAIYSVGIARLFSGGMECVVAVPLFLCLLIEIAKESPITPRRAARVGFIASLAVRRLDIALAVLLLIAGVGFYVHVIARVLAADVRLRCRRDPGAIVCRKLLLLWYLSSSVGSGQASSDGARVQRAIRAWDSTQHAIGDGGPRVATRPDCPVSALAPRWSSAAARALCRRTRVLVFAFLFFGINALTGWIIFGCTNTRSCRD